MDRRDIFPNSSKGKGVKAGLPFLPLPGSPAAPLSRLSYSGKVRKSSSSAKGNSGFFSPSSAVSRET